LDSVIEVTFLGPFQLWDFFEGEGEDGGEGTGFLFQLSLEFGAALKDVVLGSKALLEFLGSTVEDRGTVFGGGKEGSGEFSTFLVASNIFEAVGDIPVNKAESLI
jgi:hypothetical protein